MKKKKLNLEDLKVKSFVTNYENHKSETVKGGISDGTICNTQNPEFCNYTNNDWCWGSNESECNPGTGTGNYCNSMICVTDLLCTAPK